MRPPQFPLDLNDELIVDLFAGGGGASAGIEEATGRMVDIAINHDARAVAMHMVNHPLTDHYTCDVFEVDPRMVTQEILRSIERQIVLLGLPEDRAQAIVWDIERELGLYKRGVA